MPKIMQDNEQMKALSTISADLLTIETLNKLIALPADDTSFSISAKAPGSDGAGASKRGDSGKAVSAVISTKMSSKVHQILVGQRAIIVKEIIGLAAKYHIELSDEEQASISD